MSHNQHPVKMQAHATQLLHAARLLALLYRRSSFRLPCKRAQPTGERILSTGMPPEGHA